ncbi:hypothetical protein FE257_000744 [Aspergillus nanangensis]|uniref:Translation initiation factor eIF4E n=1 Tax=Aspergillus nanangensis TaxID=2582783 RepID=A0AAD4GPD2_ASPNN|nr:hypothetical protein FE257_000744 [Aspergillus nanangensis]
MPLPALHINDESTTSEEAIAQESNQTPISATRKTLHQNIFGKLRPVPFQYHWTVWYEKHSEPAASQEKLYVLHEDVADIATFYRVYNNYPWDKVRLRDTVHIFRKGVRPVWEDPENQNGGCWKFRVPKSKAQAFFHEISILCMANEFQVALEKGSINALERTILDRLSPELRPTGSGAHSYSYRRHADNEELQQQAIQTTA